MAFPMFNRRQFAASIALSTLLCPRKTQAMISDGGLNAAYQAYCIAFPIFEFARTGWATAAPTASRPTHRYNHMIYQQQLSDERNRTVTTPNRDTLYATARIDVSNGPVLVRIPSILDRYFSVAFINAFTDNFAYFGTRATGGLGGLALITGPDWSGRDAVGATVVRSETKDIWLLARVHVTGPEDQAAAYEAMRQIVIMEAPDHEPLPVAPTQSTNIANVLAVANAVLARCTPAGISARGADAYAEIGLQPGALDAWQSLDQRRQEDWAIAATVAERRLRQGFAISRARSQGWQYPPSAIGSADATWELRAGVALSGLGALEQVEATYARTDVDANGEPLIGNRHYRLEIPADVPAAAFWSVTLYVIDDDGRLFFHANPARIYTVGNRMSHIRLTRDGRTNIVISPTPPEDPLANWLPSAQGRLALVFRAYLPEPALRRGEWLLPGVRQI